MLMILISELTERFQYSLAMSMATMLAHNFIFIATYNDLIIENTSIIIIIYTKGYKLASMRPRYKLVPKCPL